MCKKHWAQVPKPLQDEVNRTVKLRSTLIGKTWAPWWRAQAAAIAYVAALEGRMDSRMHQMQAEKIALHLESRR
jgi:hypothetical protein